MLFGEILQELRKDHGLTQEEVALKLNVSRTVLSKYESNENEPNLDFLVRCSDFFHVSVDYLLGKTKISLPQDFIHEFNYSKNVMKKINFILQKFSSSKKYIDYVYAVLASLKYFK